MSDPYRATARRHLDATFSRLRANVIDEPPDGWIATIRTALGMSQADLARRMGVTGPAVRKLEESERAGTIRLETLRRAAKALDAQVHALVVPAESLEAMVQARARSLAAAELEAVNHTMALEAQQPEAGGDADIIVSRARDLLDSPRLWSDQQ